MKIPTISLAPPALDAALPEASSRGGRRARRGRWWRRLGAYALALAVLGLVFVSYLRPDMMFTLATQVWNCF